jgi:hypothetical protein
VGQHRWHSLVKCNHGDSSTSRFDSPPAGICSGEHSGVLAGEISSENEDDSEARRRFLEEGCGRPGCPVLDNASPVPAISSPAEVPTPHPWEICNRGQP